MNGPLFVTFGVIPVVVLGLFACMPLIAGFAMLLSNPAIGASLIAWATAGLAGARTMLQVWSGVYTENTTLGLLAGIAAACPLFLPGLLEITSPTSWALLYFTASPTLVAIGIIADREMFEPGDDARIVEYEYDDT